MDEIAESKNQRIEGLEIKTEADGSFRQLRAVNEGLGIEMSLIHPDNRFGGGKNKTRLEVCFSKDGSGIVTADGTEGTEIVTVAEMLGEDKERELEVDMVEEILVQKHAAKFLGLTGYRDFDDLVAQVFPDIIERREQESSLILG